MSERAPPHALDLRERLRAFGIDSLSDEDLLALVLRTGRPGENARGLARRILDRLGSSRELVRTSVQELEAIAGIGPARAASVVATCAIVPSSGASRMLRKS